MSGVKPLTNLNNLWTYRLAEQPARITNPLCPFFSQRHFNMKILTVSLIDSCLFYCLHLFSLHKREVPDDSYMKTNNLFMLWPFSPAEVIFMCAIANSVISVLMGFKWNMNYWRWALGWGGLWLPQLHEDMRGSIEALSVVFLVRQ